MVDHIYPSGATLGSTTSIELIGEFDSWPPSVWVSDPGLSIEFLSDQGKAKVRVDPDTAPGPKLLRFYNSFGAARPRFFLVSPLSELLESEPNDRSQDSNQVQELPTVLNGRLNRGGDSDSYQIPLEKGQWLIAEAFAYRLQSNVDLLMQLVDPQGTKIALNHDYHHLDPFLTCQAPESGLYTFQVMGFEYPAKADIRLGGGKNFIYRVRLDAGPYVHHTIPLAAHPSTTESLSLVGWNLPSDRWRRPAGLPHSSAKSGESVWKIALDGSPKPFEVALSPHPEDRERSTESTQLLPVPGSVTGQVETDHEEDSYQVDLVQNTPYTFTVSGHAPIHQFDPWIALEHLDGSLIKRDDDSGPGQDAKLNWTPEKSGPYLIRIGNLLENGAANYVYRLSVIESHPDFIATLNESQFILNPGSTNDVSISIARINGHNTPLQFKFRNLPVTITQSGGLSESSGKQTTLQLVTRADAPPFLGETSLVSTTPSTQSQQLVPATFLGVSVNNGVPGGFEDLVTTETPSIWITIPPQAEPEEPGDSP